MDNKIRPNILLLMADQLRYDCVGAANMMEVQTPNLDRLAEEGVFFENAFTPAPVCAPARQCLLSGREVNSQNTLWNYDMMPITSLEPNGHYWTDNLKSAGYRTAFVGKWHSSQSDGPEQFGFERNIPLSDYKAMIKEKYPNLSYEHGFFGDPGGLEYGDSESHWCCDRVCELIDEFAGEPWHIRMDITEPHLPCRPSAPFDRMYDPDKIKPWPGSADTLEGKPYIHRQQVVSWGNEDKTWDDWKRTVALYYGCISQVDDAVGRVLDKLEQSGQAENTLVIFTSDHGDMCGSRGMLDKHYIMYDDVLHIPLIMRLPKMIAAGSRCDGFVTHMLDIPPTVEELCGIEKDGVRHGYSMVPMLTGEGESKRDFTLASGSGQQFGLFSQRCIRTKKYKYVWNCADIDELYDVEKDPGELNNLVYEDGYSEVLAALRRELYQRFKEMDDPLMKTGFLDRQLLENKKL